MPGFVKVKEKLSSVSSAFDLNSRVAEETVCGMSSSLRQVTVVPVFTVSCVGAKVKLSIAAVASCAAATAWDTTAPVSIPKANAAAAAGQSRPEMSVRMTRLRTCSALQRLVDEGEPLLPAHEIHLRDAEQ